MMIPLFLLSLTAGFIGLLVWGSISLPKERWQVLAAIPIAKQPNGEWNGVNITYYGLFNGFASAAGVAILFLLLGSIGVPSNRSIALSLTLLCTGIPASRLVAWIVENRKFTFTSNGAIFIGLIVLPWAVHLLNSRSGIHAGRIAILPAMAACAVAYAYGESLGRFACISFGCCYGRRIGDLPRTLQKILRPFGFVFEGYAKKAAYEGGLEGVSVVPIQAITSGVCFLAALVGTWLYLGNHFGSAFVATMAATQLWRFASEGLRADYRGSGRITGYQVMAVAMVVYSIGLILIVPSPVGCSASLALGFRALWNPSVFLFLESVWIGAFFYYGRSKVTSATLSIHVREDRI